MQKLITTFLELAEIDEMYPHEDKVLAYVRRRLKAAKVTFVEDKIGNIIATIPGKSPEVLAICAHVDIAAPLRGRQVIVDEQFIKTDGTSILGGDDKVAVAAALELADYLAEQQTKPSRTLELIFTVGEEAGLVGALNIDMSLVQAKDMIVFDWDGPVSKIATKSPAYYKIDVVFHGKAAHAAYWPEGVNAGQALMKAAGSLQQGQFAPDVIFNIGKVEIGNARNQVPDTALLKAELRSYDLPKIKVATTKVTNCFRQAAKSAGATADIVVDEQSQPYQLDQSSELFATMTDALAQVGLKPDLVPSLGCFDSNIFADRGLNTVVLGGAYRHPHSSDEYVVLAEFRQMFDFLQRLVTTTETK